MVVGLGLVDVVPVGVALGDALLDAVADGLGEELLQMPGSGIGSGQDPEDVGLADAVADGEGDEESQTPGIGSGSGQETAGTAAELAGGLAAGAACAATTPTPAIPVPITATASEAIPARKRCVEAGFGMSTFTYFKGRRRQVQRTPAGTFLPGWPSARLIPYFGKV